MSLQTQPIQDHPDSALISVQGSIDQKTIFRFKADLQALVADGTRRFILDCEQLTYINSTGLAYLVSLAGEIEPEGGTIGLAAVDPKIKVIFRMMGLESLFTFYPSFADALEEIRSDDELAPDREPLPGGEDGAEGPEAPVVPFEEMADTVPARPSATEPAPPKKPDPPPAAPRANPIARFFRWLLGRGRNASPGGTGV